MLTPKRLNDGRPFSTREYAGPDPSKTMPERGMVTYAGATCSGVTKLASVMYSSGTPDAGSAEYTSTLITAVAAVTRDAAITSEVRENVPGPHTVGSGDWNANEIAYCEVEFTRVTLDVLVRIGAVELSVPSNTKEKTDDAVDD